MSPTHETGLDDGRGNHRRGSSSRLPRDEAPKQSVRKNGIGVFASETSGLIAFSNANHFGKWSYCCLADFE